MKSENSCLTPSFSWNDSIINLILFILSIYCSQSKCTLLVWQIVNNRYLLNLSSPVGEFEFIMTKTHLFLYSLWLLDSFLLHYCLPANGRTKMLEFNFRVVKILVSNQQQTRTSNTAWKVLYSLSKISNQ